MACCTLEHQVCLLVPCVLGLKLKDIDPDVVDIDIGSHVLVPCTTVGVLSVEILVLGVVYTFI